MDWSSQVASCDYAEIKLRIELISDEDRRLLWKSVCDSYPIYSRIPPNLVAYLLPSPVSMCLVKPPGIRDCCDWYANRVRRMMEYEFLAEEALELLCMGVRLMMGHKPLPNLSIDLAKAPSDIMSLVSVYKDICSFTRTRSLINDSLSFAAFCNLGLTDRISLLLKHDPDVCADDIISCFSSLEVDNPETISSCLTTSLLTVGKPPQIMSILRSTILTDHGQISALIISAAYASDTAFARELLTFTTITSPELNLLISSIECVDLLNSLGVTLTLANLRDMTPHRAEAIACGIFRRAKKTSDWPKLLEAVKYLENRVPPEPALAAAARCDQVDVFRKIEDSIEDKGVVSSFIDDWICRLDSIEEISMIRKFATSPVIQVLDAMDAMCRKWFGRKHKIDWPITPAQVLVLYKTNRDDLFMRLFCFDPTLFAREDSVRLVELLGKDKEVVRAAGLVAAGKFSEAAALSADWRVVKAAVGTVEFSKRLEQATSTCPEEEIESFLVQTPKISVDVEEAVKLAPELATFIISKLPPQVAAKISAASVPSGPLKSKIELQRLAQVFIDADPSIDSARFLSDEDYTTTCLVRIAESRGDLPFDELLYAMDGVKSCPFPVLIEDIDEDDIQKLPDFTDSASVDRYLAKICTSLPQPIVSPTAKSREISRARVTGNLKRAVIPDPVDVATCFWELNKFHSSVTSLSSGWTEDDPRFLGAAAIRAVKDAAISDAVKRLSEKTRLDEEEFTDLSLRGVSEQISNIVFQGFSSLVSRFK